MKLQKYQKCSEVTRGLEKAELVLKNARIVNVFTREILKGDIAIEEGDFRNRKLRRKTRN